MSDVTPEIAYGRLVQERAAERERKQREALGELRERLRVVEAERDTLREETAWSSVEIERLRDRTLPDPGAATSWPQFVNWHGMCDDCGSTAEPDVWGEDDRYAMCAVCAHVSSRTAEYQARIFAAALDATRGERDRLAAAGEHAREAFTHVVQECEGHRFGEPGYDMTLDDLYDVAAEWLVEWRRVRGGDGWQVEGAPRLHIGGSDDTGPRRLGLEGDG